MSNVATQPVTLQIAVLQQVKEFASANRPFSVHNITQEIRNKVNSGALEIPEVEVSGASFRFDIPHVKVKSIFDDLWNSGVFNPDFTLTRQFNGTFFDYTPQPVQSAAPIGTAVPASVTPANTSFTVAPSATTTTTTVVVSRNVAKERIQQYLTNCENRNFRPTLKQVQSAIKRGEVSTGYTCEDIKAIVENDLNYTVTANPDLLSASQVAL